VAGLIHKLRDKSKKAIEKNEKRPSMPVGKENPIHKSGKKHPGNSQDHLSREEAEKIRNRKKKK